MLSCASFLWWNSSSQTKALFLPSKQLYTAALLRTLGSASNNCMTTVRTTKKNGVDWSPKLSIDGVGACYPPPWWTALGFVSHRRGWSAIFTTAASTAFNKFDARASMTSHSKATSWTRTRINATGEHLLAVACALVRFSDLVCANNKIVGREGMMTPLTVEQLFLKKKLRTTQDVVSHLKFVVWKVQV